MFSAKIVLSWLNPIFELQYRVEPAQQYIHLLKFGLIRINSQKKEEGEQEKHCPFLQGKSGPKRGGVNCESRD